MDDPKTIAAHLRTLDTVEEGEAYLTAQGVHRDRDGLVAVATELRLTRMERATKPELVRRILQQAISARRKFEGLRKW
ncbi:hypothetical protein [Saccharopolyspora cebuensis]|uniref:hypothetical protein n=1 Tax=Saccharopolyspora cebuensis TaxID=418759 RepID=UPI0031E5EB09